MHRLPPDRHVECLAEDWVDLVPQRELHHLHPYDDATIETRRQRIFANFMELVSEEITRRYPDAGSIRTDARAKVIRKIQLAIEMALSKFDQVTVVGNSRLLARRLARWRCRASTCARRAPRWRRVRT